MTGASPASCVRGGRPCPPHRIRQRPDGSVRVQDFFLAIVISQFSRRSKKFYFQKCENPRTLM